MKKIAHALLVTAMAGGMALASATGASAAHCVDADGSTPGFSYFGSEVASGERDAKDTKGASTCRETTGSPSDRAPGKNK